VGIVNIHWTEPREFGEQEIELYRTLMGLATPTVESRRLLIEKERAVVETLYVISRGLNVARDEEELLQILSQPAIEAGAFLGTLMYIDLDEAGDPEWLEMAASWQLGGTPTVPIGARFRLAEFPFSHLWMASPDVPQLIDDVKTDERLDKDSRNMLTSLGIQATAIIPLNHAGRWVGLIVFNWGEPHEFSPQEAEIYDAVDGLAAPTVESRRLMDNLEQMVARRTGELDVFRELAENAADGIWLVDLEGCLTFVNKAEASIYGYDQPEEMVGLMFSDVVVAGELEFDRENTILSDGWRGELHLKRKDGSHFWAEVTTFGITDKDGQATVIAGITRDVTARKQDEAERERLQQEVIEAQQGALRELSSPIIPVMERILIMPIIGSIDDARARDITRALLAGIQEHRAKVVIMDITGVSVVDSGVAEYLNRTIQAARLKGASAIITGISDAVAETIVDLGIDWSDVDTVNNLQTGLVAAMNRLGVRLTR